MLIVDIEMLNDDIKVFIFGFKITQLRIEIPTSISNYSTTVLKYSLRYQITQLQ